MKLRVITHSIAAKKPSKDAEKPQKRTEVPRKRVELSKLGPEPEEETPKPKKTTPVPTVPTTTKTQGPAVETSATPPKEKKPKKKTKKEVAPAEAKEPEKTKEKKETPPPLPTKPKDEAEDLTPDDSWVWEDTATPIPLSDADLSTPADAVMSLSNVVDNLMSVAEKALQSIEKMPDEDFKSKPSETRKQVEQLLGPLGEQVKQLRQITEALTSQAQAT